jgi:hypothetical protein
VLEQNLARQRFTDYHSLKIARVLVHFNHVARFIVNANHSITRAAAKLCAANCIADRVWLGMPQRAVGVILIAYFGPGAANF